MRAVARAMLDDMPDPCDLHLERAAGRCAVMVGSAVLAEYAESDVVMRNFAVTTARLAGFGGTRVAEVFGLSAPYVSTLHAAALRDGSQALVKQPGPGRPRTLEGEALERARQWRAARGRPPDPEWDRHPRQPPEQGQPQPRSTGRSRQPRRPPPR